MKVFVSYSATTASAPFVRRFVERLNDALATVLGEKAQHVFADSALSLGDNWKQAMADRLNEAQVLVPLYAPLLFNSPVCGQELGFFAQRLQPAQQFAGSAPVVPVWWVPTQAVDANGFPTPPATGRALIDDLQHRSKDVTSFGAHDTNTLAREGMDYLIRNETHADFRPLVDHAFGDLAKRIAKLGHQYAGQLAHNAQPFDQAPDLWRAARTAKQVCVIFASGFLMNWPSSSTA